MLLLAHLAVRWFARGADPTLLPLVALLHGIGYVMITRLEPERLAGLQTTWSIIAIVAFVLTLAVVQRAADLARYRWTFLVLGIGLLVLPLVPGVGSSFGGARIWVSIGPVNFQPGEFAKIAFAIFFASYLADNRQLIAGGTWKVGPLHLPEPRAFLPVLAAWAFAVLVMVAEQDLGSSLLFFTLFVVMLWVSTERVDLPVPRRRVVLRRGLRVVAAVRPRPAARRHLARPVGATGRTTASRSSRRCGASSDGGLMGTGLGPGKPRHRAVAESDFIFTSIGEELGLFGAAAVLMSYLLIVGAGLRIALRTDNAFEKLLAVGLTTIMGIQTFIIVAGVIKLVPLTGITLPFVSYGGSSLVSNYVLLALLIRLSDSTARRLHEVPDDPTMAERWAARTAPAAEPRAGAAVAGSPA